jgi:hypothetical protein
MKFNSRRIKKKKKKKKKKLSSTGTSSKFRNSLTN